MAHYEQIPVSLSLCLFPSLLSFLPYLLPSFFSSFYFLLSLTLSHHTSRSLPSSLSFLPPLVRHYPFSVIWGDTLYMSVHIHTCICVCLLPVMPESLYSSSKLHLDRLIFTFRWPTFWNHRFHNLQVTHGVRSPPKSHTVIGSPWVTYLCDICLQISSACLILMCSY